MNEATMLDSNFTPGEKDVLVARGKVCYRHSGNQRLSKLVKSVLSTYSDPKVSKKGKTELIQSIVASIRESSPDGGFVKFDETTGRWYEVGNKLAREKVSQTFRDCLTDNYRSSTTSKTLRRRQQRINRQTSAGSTVSQGSSTSSSYHQTSAGSTVSQGSSTSSSSYHTYQSPSSTLAAPTPPRIAALPLLSRAPILSSLACKPHPFSSSLSSHNQALGSNPCLQLAVALAERRRTLENLLLANNTLQR